MSVYENGPQRSDGDLPAAPPALWPPRLMPDGRVMPVYVQLAEILDYRIRHGELRGGLPTRVQLCGEYGLADRTVRRALFALRHRGLIVIKRNGRCVVVEEEAEGGE